MASTTSLVELVLLLLIAASAVAVLTSRLRIPYTAALVFAGIAIDLFKVPIGEALARVGFGPGHFDLLTPEAVFTLFLPGLLFESSLHLKLRELRRNVWPIFVLAVVGVVVATLTTAGVLAWWLAVPVASALVFGALISATDPISVVALFREMGLPRRLTLIVESESLFNDGTAIVLFQVLLAAMQGNQLHVGDALVRFVVVTTGGMGLGIAVGYLASALTARVDEPRIEITLTTIAAYGVYLAAEHLHVSGVIATVATGLVVGNVGVVKGMSPRTRVALFGFWEYVAFVINSLLFLLIGIAVHLSVLLGEWEAIALATGAVLFGRLVTVYALMPLVNRVSERISLGWQHVLVWGGLHGGVSIALALGLPLDFPRRELILNMAFGVVAFSIIVQGVTMRPLVNWLALRPRRNEAYERLKAEQLAVAGAKEELEMLLAQRLITRPVHEELKADLDRRSAQVEQAIANEHSVSPAVAEEERHIARLRLAQAERSAIEHAVDAGIVSHHAAHDTLIRAVRRIDAERTEDGAGD